MINVDDSARPRKRRWLRRLGAAGLLLLLTLSAIMIDVWTALGRQPSGERLARLEQSPQFVDGRFVNTLPAQNDGPSFEAIKEWFFGDKTLREPQAPLPVIERVAADFATPSDDLRITWFGHSSMLIELDGRRILTDPVWGDYASPGPLFGVKRFYSPPIPLGDLPPLDAVVLSHDHYDHLNEETIRALAERVPRFIAPLGLGAHLEYWGVPPERIVELDWWEQVDVAGVTVVCTPARHFSGRHLTDRNATLWASWSMLGETQRVFFSGDTALFPGFEDIGARLGPFDVTMMEVGAYNASWSDVHMGPEQAVVAHQMVRGRQMMPIHWGTFNLAFHGWTEPVERLLVAAEAAGIDVAVPRPGETLRTPLPATPRWWPELPWQRVEEAPVVSSGLTIRILEID